MDIPIKKFNKPTISKQSNNDSKNCIKFPKITETPRKSPNINVKNEILNHETEIPLEMHNDTNKMLEDVLEEDEPKSFTSPNTELNNLELDQNKIFDLDTELNNLNIDNYKHILDENDEDIKAFENAIKFLKSENVVLDDIEQQLDRKDGRKRGLNIKRDSLSEKKAIENKDDLLKKKLKIFNDKVKNVSNIGDSFSTEILFNNKKSIINTNDKVDNIKNNVKKSPIRDNDKGKSFIATKKPKVNINTI